MVLIKISTLLAFCERITEFNISKEGAKAIYKSAKKTFHIRIICSKVSKVSLIVPEKCLKSIFINHTPLETQ